MKTSNTGCLPGVSFVEETWDPEEALMSVTIDTSSRMTREFFRLECPSCGQLLMQVQGRPTSAMRSILPTRLEDARDTHIKDVRTRLYPRKRAVNDR